MSEKECKGRAAARALAVMVLDRKIAGWLAKNDPMALRQARVALIPFGYPGPMSLTDEANRPKTPPEDPGPPECWKAQDEAFSAVLDDLAHLPED